VASVFVLLVAAFVDLALLSSEFMLRFNLNPSRTSEGRSQVHYEQVLEAR